MARRRMFSLDVVDTDRFLDMSPTTQNLYFHLGMRADDDGFVSSPKKIAAMCSSTIDDLKLLIAKGFVIPFENGVILITDWKVNNYIRKDRYTETRFKEYFDTVEVENDKYILALPSVGLTYGIPKVNQAVDKGLTNGCHRLGKDSIGEYSEGVLTNDSSTKDDNNNIFNTTSISTVRRENNQGDEERKFTPPTFVELMEYKDYYPNVDLYKFFEHYEGNGWTRDGLPMTSWKAALKQCNDRNKNYL